MSDGYLPKFSSRGLAGFQALEPWLQEEVLDEVGRLIESVPVPTVGQRLEPVQSLHDMARVSAGLEHVVFITTVLDVAGREMRIIGVGHLARPDPG